MKNTMDYMAGNTAIRIVNKGNKIRIVDVEKEKRKKKFRKKCIATTLAALLVLSGCMYVVALQNTQVFLEEEVYELKEETRGLEEENLRLARDVEQREVDYKTIYTKAKALGMKFPKKGQICKYTADKSTAVRVNKSYYKK